MLEMVVQCICIEKKRVAMDKIDQWFQERLFSLFLHFLIFFIWYELCERNEGIQQK